MRPSWLAPALLLTVLLPATAQGQAPPLACDRHPIGAHVELGSGVDGVRPMGVEKTSAVIASAGANMVLLPRIRLAVEASATGGGDLGKKYIPEAARPGTRTLQTLLFGFEMSGERSLGVPYLFAGIGPGRMTLKDARNADTWPIDPSPPLPKDQRGLAIGGGLGYRCSGGPFNTGWQLGIRSHAMLHAGSLVAWANCWTVGLAY